MSAPTPPEYIDAVTDYVIARLQEQHSIDNADRMEDDPRSLGVCFFDGSMVYVRIAGVPIPNPESGERGDTPE